MFDLAVFVVSCASCLGPDAWGGPDAGTFAGLFGSFDPSVDLASVLDILGAGAGAHVPVGGCSDVLLPGGGAVCGFAAVLPTMRLRIAGLPGLVLLLSLFLPLSARPRKDSGDEGANPSDVPVSELSAALVYQLLAAARLHAARQRVKPDLAEDCAGEFVLRLLLRHARPGGLLPLDGQGQCPAAWLNRAAINHVKNFRRDQMCHERHTVLWADLDFAENGPGAAQPSDANTGAVNLQDLGDPSAAPSLDAFVLRAEFWDRARSVLARLPVERRALFVRHRVEGESLEQIAASLGKSPDAVRKDVARSHARLQKLLAGQGVRRTDLDEYCR